MSRTRAVSWRFQPRAWRAGRMISLLGGFKGFLQRHDVAGGGLPGTERAWAVGVGGGTARGPGRGRRLDAPPPAVDDGTLDGRLQLLDVAGPGIAAEHVERLGAEAGDRPVDLAGEAGAEVVREPGDVVTAVPEWREFRVTTLIR